MAITVENIYAVKRYLKIPKRIQRLEQLLARVSPDYYQSHSFTGVGIPYDLTDTMQGCICPENGALEIITKENVYKKLIKKLSKRYLFFVEEFTLPEIEHLKQNIYSDLDLLVRACKQIDEINEYYEFMEESVIYSEEDKENIEEVHNINDQLEEMFGGI
ncbi:hypothetical protein [Facklamia sp. P12955]|uniref:hypothetical protein n=1 Tax=Facklamia sp. P12955 TaxID=3421946 RepID=UPI003D1730BD